MHDSDYIAFGTPESFKVDQNMEYVKAGERLCQL